MVKNESLPWKLNSMLLALLVSGCAAPISPPPSEPERFPELPPSGRVSLIPIPSECSPSCLAGLTRARKSSEDMLTGSGLLAPSVSGVGTPDYSLPSGKLPMSNQVDWVNQPRRPETQR